LARLAHAARTLDPAVAGPPLAEDGPREVALAARAFNALRRRIEQYLGERLRILAAVSHDLQTPITRMRLRAELLDDTALRDKLQADLDAMHALVREGLDYARSAHGVDEPPSRIDLQALLDSLACDYADAGAEVRCTGSPMLTLQTRSRALRRIVSNLLDNAIKFAGSAELSAWRDTESATGNAVCIAVCDRGPGIPADQLGAVTEPFYRVESSRSRDTGGSGLGLAIAEQLARTLGGTLHLANREGGGLEARLRLPYAIAG
jgi:signal transduction histidine kinase